jgi:hypothetical protein
LRGEPAEHHIGRVDDMPGALDIGGLGLVRAHVKGLFVAGNHIGIAYLSPARISFTRRHGNDRPLYLIGPS